MIAYAIDRGDRLQPGVRRLGLPRATSSLIAVVGHGASYLHPPAARARRSSPSRSCSSCSPGSWRGSTTRTRSPACSRSPTRGRPCAPTSGSSATTSSRRRRRWSTSAAGRSSPGRRWRRRCGSPTRSPSGPRRAARRSFPGAVLFVFVAALGVDETADRHAASPSIGAGFCALALLRQRLERRPRTVLGTAAAPAR